MSDKSAQKKKYIVEKAREVFLEKGFKEVTMKDIVEACDISRGGLYLYFQNTKELFEEVLKFEQEDTDDVFDRNITKEATPSDILALFLKEQKKEILSKKPSLNVAIYEYFFRHKVPSKDNLLKKQFDGAVYVIEKLIQAGIQSGEFYCEDPRGAARNIMYVLEGIKIASNTRGIPEAAVDREILYVMQGLVAEE
ncbi:MAG: TetR/AcrR family transcriptional regulator [Lachnospiraceae bacterium]|nr:TetR/AcrR family transcriptional regulator [Lachnospiraceae bacterium]GFI02622.1 putative HTH-type transcriptional regulator YfiR [Lachnospiraceae bacterium]